MARPHKRVKLTHDSSSQEVQTQAPSAPNYQPRVWDVLAVKQDLASLSRYLPSDIVELIIDFAQYWPHTTTFQNVRTLARGRSKEHVFVMRSVPLCVDASKDMKVAPKKTTFSEPRLRFPARRIVWTIKSHDQGWSGEPADTKGTYHNSWTGFDAGVERFHPAKGSEETPFDRWSSSDYMAVWPDQVKSDACGEPLETLWPVERERDPWGPLSSRPDEAHYAVPNPPVWPRNDWTNRHYKVQDNLQAKTGTTTHTVTWDWTDDIDPASDRAKQELQDKGRGNCTGDGSLVRKLQRGDCVTLWAHAYFPGWINHVKSASIEVYFAV